ncbi:MAG: ComEA family DNA-binding protein [Erysipelotrichaceae bacterium]|nr:ComEA family DNA-binding protein [Erysipelotrichaceae bacterium]
MFMKRMSVFLLLITLGLMCDLTPLSFSKLRKDTIRVNVQGEVEQEGEYELDLYSTVQDALDAAGISEDADTSGMNPSALLKDADLIIVPQKKAEGETQRISINTADVDELCKLSGIGPSTAQRIIEYRNENGLFQQLEDLMKVKGIGQSRFEKIRDDICL